MEGMAEGAPGQSGFRVSGGSGPAGCPFVVGMLSASRAQCLAPQAVLQLPWPFLSLGCGDNGVESFLVYRNKEFVWI